MITTTRARNDTIEVMRTISPTEREMWRFWWGRYPWLLELDEYEHQTRQSSRHKFRLSASFDRWSRLGRDKGMDPSDVLLPPEVVTAALECARGLIEVIGARSK
jgi:hypothetical protein